MATDHSFDNQSLKAIEKQLLVYRKALLDAKSLEKDKSFVKQYDDHIKSLDKIENAVNNNNLPLLKYLIDSESRYFGWSYLPNDYGENAENGFWQLKKLILNE